MGTFRFTGDQLTVVGTVGALPAGYTSQVARARVQDDFGIRDSEGTALVVSI